MSYNQAYSNELVGARKSSGVKVKPVPVDISDKKGFLVLKRVFDFLISALALVILSPVLFVVSFSIRVTTGASALFSQERIGRDQRPFTVYKFRTMKPSAPDNVATNDLDDADNYITRIGKFLRKTSIDELPQLLNVFKGDMSIIGPRPLIRSEAAIHDLRSQNGVYQIRPGLTGWAQINGRDYLTDEEKVDLDTEYLRRLSVKFDVLCIIRTISVVFSGKGFADGRK